jgi:hypothetical protein
MTTIAANARTGQMAYEDGWQDDTVRGSMKKVFRIRGDLYGLAGTVGAFPAHLRWVKDGMAEPAPKMKGADYVVILILRGKKLYTWTAADGLCEEGNKLFAIGTGAAAARGALLAGADVRTAVKIACRIDATSSGRVHVLKLKKETI